MAAAAWLDEVPTGLWPDWSDARVTAAVSLAGDAAPFARNGLAELDVPVLAIGGRKVEVGLSEAKHFVFAGRCESVRFVAKLVPIAFCSDPGWQRARAHDVVEHYVTAFRQAELRDDPAAIAEMSRQRAPDRGVNVRTRGYCLYGSLTDSIQKRETESPCSRSRT